MKESTLVDYESSKFAKAMVLAEPKEGKSCFAVAQILGVFPGQKEGGIIDHPQNLHVLTFDSGALAGVGRFLTETCGASKEALGFRVYNLEEDYRKAMISMGEWDHGFYTAIQNTLLKVKQRAKGTPVLLISSLTGVGQALMRAISGPPTGKKSAGMDQSKWGGFAFQMSELRNQAQEDGWHCIWEAHVMKKSTGGQGAEQQQVETLAIQGQTGQNFAYNVEQVFRLRRMAGQKIAGTQCDTSFLDTRPSMEIIANGRNFTEALQPRESDFTAVMRKLKLKTGHWGAPSGKPAGAPVAVAKMAKPVVKNGTPKHA